MVGMNRAALIAQIGALTTPKVTEGKSIDLSGAVDSFNRGYDRGVQIAEQKDKKQKTLDLIDALTGQHPEDEALIKSDPLAYAKMLQDNANAERDQQYELDKLGKQFENALALEDKRNANAVGLQRLAQSIREEEANNATAQRLAALDEEFKSGRISEENYNKAKSMINLGNSLYKIAYGGGGIDFDAKGVADLRKEFQAKNKDYYTVGDAFSKIKKVSEKPSAAGDLSLIFNYMKMLDPNSVVRESEFENAENARAWFDQTNAPTAVRLAYQKAISGQKLLPEQRLDFLNQAQNLFDAQAERFKNESDFYTNIANQSGYDPSYVIYNPYNFNNQAPAGNIQVGQTIGGFKIIGVK